MSIWVTLEMGVKAGAYESLSVFLNEKLPAVRSFEGAMSVSVLFDDQTNRLLLLEEWKSKPHHQAYIAAISTNGVMEQLLAFMTGAPKVKHFQRVMI